MKKPLDYRSPDCRSLGYRHLLKSLWVSLLLCLPVLNCGGGDTGVGVPYEVNAVPVQATYSYKLQWKYDLPGHPFDIQELELNPQTRDINNPITTTLIEGIQPGGNIGTGYEGYTFSNKTAGKVYAYKVRATRIIEEPPYNTVLGKFSAAVIINVNDYGLPPSVPENFQAQIRSREVNLAWTAPTQGGVVKNYRVQQRHYTTTWGAWEIINSNVVQTAYDIILADIGQYQYRVAACGAINNCSSYTAEKEIVVTESDIASANAPKQPTQPTVTSVGDNVGTTQGEFTVDEAGAATYSVPIYLAPGTAGVTPQMALQYSSQSANGLLGIGWSLTGFSSINRCQQTIASDTQSLGITWSGNDRLCFEGQKLNAVSGNYWANGTEYRTEIESYAIITQMQSSSGYAYFKVEKKDGSIAYYGLSEASASSGTEAILAKRSGGTEQDQKVIHNVYSWALHTFSDSAGNKITYHYLDDANGQRLDQVRYAYGGGATHNAYLALVYEERDDDLSYYKGGFEFIANKRIKQVNSYNRVSSSGSYSVVRSYQLAYLATSSSTNKLSRLNTITECSALTSGTCYSPTVFNWPSATDGFPTVLMSNSANHIGTEDKIIAQPADINGDGKQDLVYVSTDIQSFGNPNYELHYAISDGTKLVVNTSFRQIVNSGTAFKFHVVDYDNDGDDDVIRLSGSTWYLHRSNGVSLSETEQPLFDSVAKADSVMADMNADGLPDILYFDPENYTTTYRLMQRVEQNGAYVNQMGAAQPLNVTLSAGTMLNVNSASVQVTIPWGNPTRVASTLADFNGDGNSDVIFYGGAGVNCLSNCAAAGLLNGNGFAQLLLAYTAQSNGSFALYGAITTTANSDIDQIIPADVNQDGFTDLLVKSPQVGYVWDLMLSQGDGTFKTVQSLAGLPLDNVSLTDYNHDGYADLLYPVEGSEYKTRLYNSSTRSFGSELSTGLPYSTHRAETYVFLDVNGDGQQDAARLRVDRPGEKEEGNADLTIWSSGAANKAANVIDSIDNGLGNVTKMTYASLSNRTVYTPEKDAALKNWWQNSTDPNSSPGWVFGYNQNLSKPINQPVVDLLRGMFVVSNVRSTAPLGHTQTNGTAAESEVEYDYQGAKVQAGGRGSLGFHRVFSYDKQSTLETITTFRQDYPFTGRPEYTAVRKKGSPNLISSGWNYYAFQNWGNGHDTAPYKIFAQSVSDKKFDLETGQEISQVDTNYLLSGTSTSSYDDWGNPTRIEVNTYQDGNHGTNQQILRTETLNEYAPSGLDSEYSKQKGRLSKTTVKQTRSGPALERSSVFTYYTSGTQKGLLESEVAMEAETYALTKTYYYDAFGNLVKTEQSGKANVNGTNEQVRYTRSEYDSLGRYIDKTYVKLPTTAQQTQSELLTQQVLTRDKFGQPLTVKNSDGVQTTFKYTALGRQYHQYTETGDYETVSYATSHTDCPTGTAFAISKTGGGKPTQVMCNDPVGRVVRTSTVGFDGSAHIYSDTEYDTSGRVQFQSEPYFSNGIRLWVEHRYDDIGRLTKTIFPDYTENNLDYQGRTTVATNRINYATQQTSNVLGEVTQVIDENNGKIDYQYDALGNLLKTLHYTSMSSTTPVFETVLEYDNLGRKKKMIDKDKGTWFYEFNAFGELVKQVDAKAQTLLAEFDVMGRQARRVDYDVGSFAVSDTVWGYDIDVNNAPILGKLALANIQSTAITNQAASAQTLSYFYDSKGRPSRVAIDIDGQQFTTSTTYDQFGRVFQEFDASGRYQGIEKIYNTSGYLSEVRESSIANGGSQKKYLTNKKMNARQQLEEFEFSNGYTTTKAYAAETGYLKSIRTLYQGISAVQDMQTEWDALGNLKFRWDVTQGQKEAFCYDSLNRLTSVTEGVTSQSCTAAVPDFRYDAFGNITEKQGVGTYLYTSARPHAVTNAGGVIYTYDNNGNVTGDTSNRTFKYTTFDKPYRLEKGSDTINFWYGIDRERYKRKDSDGRQVLYVGNVEFHTSGSNSNVEIRRFLGGDIQVTEVRTQSNNRLSNTVQYLLRDHLNSVQVVLRDEAAGAQHPIQTQMSFDAWGSRRAINNWVSVWWDYNSQVSAINSILTFTSRGYTGHEMLDKLGVIHMNGRIYDAKLGRFLQADPIVQNPYSTQDYNRYSYVNNNPLKYTDPTGYRKGELGRVAGSVLQVFGSAMLGGPLAPFGWGLIAIGGMMSGYANGDMGRGLGTALVSAYTFNQIGATFTPSGKGFFQEYGVGHILTHSFAAGAITVLQGGKFGHGFVTAGVMVGLTPTIRGFGGGFPGQTLAMSVVGGTLSELTGGKFSNGAVTSAMAFAIGSLGAKGNGGGRCDASDPSCYSDVSSISEIFDGDVIASADLPSLPQGLVDFSAGFGDGLLLGYGDELRSYLAIDSVNSGSGYYVAGSAASYTVGGGRVAYAATMKIGARLAPSGIAANAFRNNMKGAFRFGMAKNYRTVSYTDALAKYGTDAAVQAAAGRTNTFFNLYGAGILTGGALGD